MHEFMHFTFINYTFSSGFGRCAEKVMSKETFNVLFHSINQMFLNVIYWNDFFQMNAF